MRKAAALLFLSWVLAPSSAGAGGLLCTFVSSDSPVTCDFAFGSFLLMYLNAPKAFKSLYMKKNVSLAVSINADTLLDGSREVFIYHVSTSLVDLKKGSSIAGRSMGGYRIALHVSKSQKRNDIQEGIVRSLRALIEDFQ